MKSRLVTSRLVALAVALSFATIACEPDAPPQQDADEVGEQTAPLKGEAVPFDKLPVAAAPDSIYLQALEKPTKANENVVLHVKLPPTTDPRLRKSLVRVVGAPANPLVLFQSDALAKLRLIPASPGRQFFTTFGKFDAAQLDERAAAELAIGKGRFGDSTRLRHVFNGRHAVAVGPGVQIERAKFIGGSLLPFGACFFRPLSTPAAWGRSLFVTDPAVVQDAARTWDPCTGAGTHGASWTFAHLMRELAQGSGVSPEEFTLRWLSEWLDTRSINSESIPNFRASEMVTRVIRPWATASGVTTTSSCVSLGPCTVSLSGPLNLDIAPFRLMAIVNRIDLGGTSKGRSGYGGSITDRPADAGELRFVFSVVNPAPSGPHTEATCGLMPFNVIFEYGVPIEGCEGTVAWAKRWTELNTFTSFSSDYLSKLEAITESVVLHGAAPFRGNQSALNQIRTNEIALSDDWELRQFTLTDEDPVANTDLPSDGLLRRHTVSQTMKVSKIAGPDPFVDDYVENVVIPGLSSPVGPLPDDCTASYEVPYSYLGAPFRGARALLVFDHTRITTAPVTPAEICARHQLSLNTCMGCHQGDTLTPFVHVQAGHIPAVLSSFLTGVGGGGAAFGVPDTQVGSPTWPFADLDRRFQRLFDIAHCTECLTHLGTRPSFLARMAEIAGVVPIDPGGPIEVNFKIGPIDQLTTLQSLFAARTDFVNARANRDVAVDFVRLAEIMTH